MEIVVQIISGTPLHRLDLSLYTPFLASERLNYYNYYEYKSRSYDFYALLK